MKNVFNEVKAKYPLLKIPKFIFGLKQEYIEEHTNGCGDKTTAWIIPSDILGLNITQACNIHDLEYTRIINYYHSLFDLKLNKDQKMKLIKDMKKEADLTLRDNIKILADYEFILNKKGVFSLFFWRSETKQARIRRKEHYKLADLYYFSVRRFGWNAIKDNLED